MEVFYRGISGEPVFVQGTTAARVNWATPKPARLCKDNSLSAGRIDGGAFILVGIHWNLTVAGTDGWVINHIFNGTTTAIWSKTSDRNESGSMQLWRPLAGPIVSGGSAVNGGRLALAITGAPAAGSWIGVELLHHHDVTLKGTWTATGADVVFTG